MDYNQLLKVGQILKNKYLVDENDTADALGNKGVRVLSTPALLRYVEDGSSTEIFKQLPEGYSPVGTYIDLKHLGATPVSGIIEVVSYVYKIKGNRITYNFEVFYKDKMISKGVYEQAIVCLKDFLQKTKDI